MKASIGIGWPIIFCVAGYLDRGWEGVWASLLIMALYAFVLFPLMARLVRKKYE